jgi:hypothetical protein
VASVGAAGPWFLASCELAFTWLLASFGGELAFTKLLARFDGERAFTRLFANLGGGFALDSKGKSQEDLDACILVDPAPGQGCRGKVNACKGL